MERDELIKRAQKLKALADRGEGGEARNAKDQLEILLRKNNVTLEELLGEERERLFIRTTLNESSTILQRVILSIRPDAKIVIGKKKSTLFIKATLTVKEFHRVNRKYDALWKNYNENRGIFLSAWLNKNSNYFIPKGKKINEDFFNAGVEKKEPPPNIKTAAPPQVEKLNKMEIGRTAKMMDGIKIADYYDEDFDITEHKSLGKDVDKK